MLDKYDEVMACFIFFIEYNMSYREIAKEMMFKSHNTVKNRLEMLSEISDDLYMQYKNKAKTHKGGRK